MGSQNDAGGGIAISLRRIKIRGFTDDDVTRLRAVHRSGMADYGWGVARFAINDFSHHFIVWGAAQSHHDLPALSIVRFDESGTYVLLKDGWLVASGKSLDALMPAAAAVGRIAVQDRVSLTVC